MDERLGEQLITVADYEARSRRLMPTGMFPVLFGGHGEPGWQANTNNLDGFSGLRLRPRIMKDVSDLDLSTTVLGQRIEVPMMTGPAGMHQRFHADGELGTIRGTKAAGSVMILSTAASYSIEELAAADPGPLWFQLYCFKDRPFTASLVERAEASGYRAIVVTVDNPGVRSRERDHRHGFSWDGQGNAPTLEPERVMRNFQAMTGPGVPNVDTFYEQLENKLDWSYFEWLRSLTSLPLVIKGVQTYEDGLEAVRHGADAIVVSNHGGHALHDAGGTISILPEVMDAVGDELEVYLDGGIRSGTDVLKSLALGARAVLLGRAYLWGLCVDGGDGLRNVYDILRDELSLAMTYCGVKTVQDVPVSLVRAPDRESRPRS